MLRLFFLALLGYCICCPSSGSSQPKAPIPCLVQKSVFYQEPGKTIKFVGNMCGHWDGVVFKIALHDFRLVEQILSQLHEKTKVFVYIKESLIFPGARRFASYAPAVFVKFTLNPLENDAEWGTQKHEEWVSVDLCSVISPSKQDKSLPILDVDSEDSPRSLLTGSTPALSVGPASSRGISYAALEALKDPALFAQTGGGNGGSSCRKKPGNARGSPCYGGRFFGWICGG